MFRQRSDETVVLSKLNAWSSVRLAREHRSRIRVLTTANSAANYTHVLAADSSTGCREGQFGQEDDQKEKSG